MPIVPPDPASALDKSEPVAVSRPGWVLRYFSHPVELASHDLAAADGAVQDALVEDAPELSSAPNTPAGVPARPASSCPPLEDAARVSCFLADQPRWSVYWDKKYGRCADSLSRLAKATERAGFGDGHAACRARPVMSGGGSHAGWLPSRTSLSLPRFCATAALILGVASGAASLSMAWEASSSTLLTSRVPPALASSS